METRHTLFKVPSITLKRGRDLCMGGIFKMFRANWDGRYLHVSHHSSSLADRFNTIFILFENILRSLSWHIKMSVGFFDVLTQCDLCI